MSTDPRVAVIGAGMSGILCGVRLQEAGLGDYAIYEKAPRLGGTWRDNTYPGLSCDVPSHVYSYSFESNPDWSQRFSPGSEIQAYLERTADKYGVSKAIRCGREITRCERVDGRWHLHTDDGEVDVADFVISATGVLHHPHIPDFEGMYDFEGALFHSACWDHSVPLEGMRVGVIGTGSTAVQIVSALSERVDSLTLFQRTAQWIMPAGESRPTVTEDREMFRRRSGQALRHAARRVLTRSFADSTSPTRSSDADSPQHEGHRGPPAGQNLEENVRDPALRREASARTIGPPASGS